MALRVSSGLLSTPQRSDRSAVEMPGEPDDSVERVRSAEVIAATCLATDLGMGFPFEHGLHTTLMAMRLADLLSVSPETASQTYYASLLTYSGCTTDADLATEVFGGSALDNLTPRQFGSGADHFIGAVRSMPPPNTSALRRPYEVARRLSVGYRFREPHFEAMCEVAGMLAERLGVPSSVHRMFFKLTERWDGKSVLRRAKGDEVPLPIRITHVAEDAAFQRVIGGEEHAVETIRSRAGHAFDPAVAEAFTRHADEVFSATEGESAWEATLRAEPRPHLHLEGEAIDRAIAAMGDFADMVSPTFTGHSRGVADLAAAAAFVSGFDGDGITGVRRAALVHDLGRVAVHPRVWLKTGPLTADDWEQVRLHPYHTERVLSRSSFLTPMSGSARAHHERLDGTGYHRGVSAPSLSASDRLIAAADSFRAMTESRPHRGGVAPEEAARRLVEDARAGRLDADMVSAVCQVAGEPGPRPLRPAGLTEREGEVIGLLGRGLQTKQVARRLDISVKTADRHIQNAYRKMGVSSRAGATLFAVEHGLIPPSS
jgi:HD-GYP domain-containing protein (c-di-GMP phosphodiesterase class II)